MRLKLKILNKLGAKICKTPLFVGIFAPDFKIRTSMKVRANRMKVYFRNSMKPKLHINEICMKLDLQLIAATVLSIGGLILLFCGVFIDPQGQIHETLLVAFGETATFAGALFGIDYVYKKRS